MFKARWNLQDISDHIYVNNCGMHEYVCSTTMSDEYQQMEIQGQI